MSYLLIGIPFWFAGILFSVHEGWWGNVAVYTVLLALDLLRLPCAAIREEKEDALRRAVDRKWDDAFGRKRGGQ